MNVFTILVGIAGLLAVLSMIKQTAQWPLVAVAVLLIAVALLVGRT